jgi:hypothetical protein
MRVLHVASREGGKGVPQRTSNNCIPMQDKRLGAASTRVALLALAAPPTPVPYLECSSEDRCGCPASFAAVCISEPRAFACRSRVARLLAAYRFSFRAFR